MEEQRARQEDEARKAVAASASEAGVTVQKMEGTCVGLLLAMHFAPITKQPSNNPGPDLQNILRFIIRLSVPSVL